MGIRETVFGSSMEKRCFRKLNETWGKDYHIYHNLPFLNVFKGRTELFDDSYESFKLSEEEYDLLKKTSIDFTICDKKDKPLVCIEFDGMQEGFNVGTTYHLRNGTPGRKRRREITELKLRVAHGSHFPYLILGSEEFRGLSDAVRLNIADGLIGEVMSLRATRKQIDAGFDPKQCGYTSDEFDGLSPEQQSEVIQDWVLMTELESDVEHNPIVSKVMQLEKELNVSGFTMTFLNEAERDPQKWVWVECGVTSHRYGEAAAKVYLPNFKTPFCYFTIHVAQEIAHLLALEQLRKKKKRCN